MVRINLLPHREQKRHARQRQFVSMAIGLAVLAIVVVGLVHVVIAASIDNQGSRNKLLQEEIAKLDEQIKEIDKLREQTQALLARKQIVETLQANRTEAVHLLDQLVRQLPDGLYLKSVKQTGGRVTLVGYAQSNARVSTLMRNIESSPWLTLPELVEIKSVPLEKQKINEFTLNLQVKRLTDSTAPGAPGKALLFFLILAAGAFFDWRDQFDALDKAQDEEIKLREAYASKKAKAVNLDLYVQQLKEIEQSFGALLKQLPNKSEMDALLTDINQAGLGRGLQFELFRPATQERMADFYAELPISVRITGNYHDMGAFASDVAQLPRIVTLNDVGIVNDKGTLTMEATAKTYRYLDEEEVAKQRKSAKDAKDKGKK
jgi:type IV pilus assembly protein PilO